MCCSVDIFLGVIAIIFPPFPVWVKTGLCSADSLINILLCILGYIPGLLHSWFIIAKYPETEYEIIPRDAESGRVTYIYVQTPGGPQQAAPPKNPPPTQGYGTTVPMNAPPVHQEQNGAWSGAGGEGSSAGPSAAPPPTYAQAVEGDHKVQTV